LRETERACPKNFFLSFFFLFVFFLCSHFLPSEGVVVDIEFDDALTLAGAAFATGSEVS
jgi:hypothetical protein